MTASDDDLIRRGDALEAFMGYDKVGDIKDAIASIQAMQVAVKPLEWIKHPSKDIWRATVGLGMYKVFGITSPSWDFDSWSDAEDKVSQSAPTIEAAKAAAQADYDARIRSALTTQPSPDVAELVALLAEARTDLATYVDADWPEHQRSFFPVVQEKWKRDMVLCWQIDAALARVKGGAA